MSADAEESLNHEDGLAASLEDLESRLIRKSLHETSWNRGQAAEFLKISRWTLQRKMIKHGLVEKENKD